MKRRMAAILVADVVGYSGLMEADENGTAQRLSNCRKLIDAEIAKCDGRLFKAMGDAVLVEFAESDKCSAMRRRHSGCAAAGWAGRRHIAHALWFASR